MSVEVVEGRIATPDQVNLYYSTRGSGLPLVFCNGIGVSTASFWTGMTQPLSRHYRVINWDYRGHGLSDPPQDHTAMSIRLCADDLKHLLDHLQIEKAVVVGHSMGVQVGFEFIRHYPERLLGFVPILGTFATPFNNFMRLSQSADVFRRIFAWVQTNPTRIQAIWPWLFEELWARPITEWSSRLFGRWGMLIHPEYCPPEELSIYLAHMKRLCPLTFFHLANSMQEHSAEDLLDQLTVPTLIFAGDLDIFTPLEASRTMLQRIPLAELEIVREGSHAALAEHPAIFWKRIDDFLQQHIAAA